jgi:hypothetical protein
MIKLIFHLIKQTTIIGIIFYYLFIYPFQIASKRVDFNIYFFSIGLVFYFFTIWIVIEYVYHTFATLYNSKRRRIFQKKIQHIEFFFPPDKKLDELPKLQLVLTSFFSYFLLIYMYALSYLFIGNFKTLAFTKEQLSISEAIYYSFTSITAGPAGLEANCFIIRLINISEIMFGMIYSILIFSFIVTVFKPTFGENSSGS